MSCRLIVLGLDAFEISIAESMMASGQLPHLSKLDRTAAKFDLDHGKAKATGLAWEHVATGQAPGKGGRWSAVSFDTQSYSVRQLPTRAVPVFGQLSAKTVVFDMPYFDLSKTQCFGMTPWGAHDPGVESHANPVSLTHEVQSRFGTYAAGRWIYGFTWPSELETQQAGRDLAAAVRQRAEVAEWLLGERFPDWEVAVIGVSELHSGIEQFWHGVDPQHPLHGLPSGARAKIALEDIYRELDDLVGRLRENFSEANVVAFSMHGMGENTGDVPAMALLPELMYRLAFGKPYALRPSWKKFTEAGIPLLVERQNWSSEVNRLLPAARLEHDKSLVGRVRRRLVKWSDRVRAPRYSRQPDIGNLTWLPAARYQPFWNAMPAFALPAYYDGQIRLNVVGREGSGIVPLDAYKEERDKTVAELKKLRCMYSGLPCVEEIWFPETAIQEREDSEADIYIQWRPNILGMIHPTLGTIGPYPYRRTGGHTGDRGIAWIESPRLSGFQGRRSAFDLVPTIFDLLNRPLPEGITGYSLLALSNEDLGAT